MLKEKVQAQRIIDEGKTPAQPLIIHIGGFERKGNYQVPYVFHIRNVYKVGHFGYLDIRKEFDCRDQFWPQFEETHPSEIRRLLCYPGG